MALNGSKCGWWTSVNQFQKNTIQYSNNIPNQLPDHWTGHGGHPFPGSFTQSHSYWYPSMVHMKDHDPSLPVLAVRSSNDLETHPTLLLPLATRGAGHALSRSKLKMGGGGVCVKWTTDKTEFSVHYKKSARWLTIILMCTQPETKHTVNFNMLG